ncbi:MAG TPA: NADH oxidase [Chloroflexi bacterium]|nr:NADH oxidase [Chloroflexota bacterium]
MTKRVVVIGGVAAGMSAAAKAKRVDPALEVVVYERGPYISYGACGMPYFIAGDVPDYQDLIARTPEQMAEQGVKVHLHHKVVGIAPDAHTVTVRDGEREQEFVQEYDRLVIATGARALELPLPGADLPGLFVLRSLVDGIAVKQFLDQQSPQQAVVIGGGYVGVEMAETFRRLGLAVTMVIRSGQVMRQQLDHDVRALVEDEMARHGVDVITGTPTGFEGDGRVEGVVLEGGERLAGDVVLLGLGVHPDGIPLAELAGAALGRTGAIATDGMMRTNVPDIYAAGDCAEVFHLVTGEPDYVPLGSTANKQGRTAGENAAGGQAAFAGIVGTMVVRAFDLAVARTGLTTAEAEARGYSVRGVKIRASNRARYFPGAAPIHVKLIVDDETDRLLGGQIVGQDGVAKRVDVLATALHHRLTVADLQQLDLSYAPPFSPVWDPILVAANVVAK